MTARKQGLGGAAWRRLLFDLQAFVGLNQAVDQPSKARIFATAFVEAVEGGELPDRRIGTYVAQALSRLATGQDGQAALARAFGLDGSVSGMTQAATILRQFFATLDSGDQPRQTIDLRIAAAVKRAAESGKGNLAKQLGIQRMQAGNPGGPSQKRRLTPGDREEIPVRFGELLVAEAARAGESDAGSARTRAVEALATEYNVGIRTIETCLRRARDEAQEQDEILNPLE